MDTASASGKRHGNNATFLESLAATGPDELRHVNRVNESTLEKARPDLVWGLGYRVGRALRLTSVEPAAENPP